MKNNVLKYYLTALYVGSTFVMYAQPGDASDSDSLEGADAPAAPIDNYIWILSVIALVYVFLKFRYIQNNKI